MNNTALKSTAHALQRCQERRIPFALLDLLYQYADLYIPEKGERTMICCTKKVLKQLAGTLPHKTINQLAGLVMVLSSECHIITAYREMCH